MITNERKEETCKKYFDIIEMVYEFGNGLFFRKDLFHFCKKFYGYSKKDFLSALMELKNSEVIETIKISNVTLIKLKKYALRNLTGKGRENIGSITITGQKITKLAFITQIIWKIYKVENITFSEVLRDLNKYSSFFLKEKEGHLFLQKFLYLIEIDENIVKTQTTKHMVNTEISTLLKNYNNSLSNLDKKNRLAKIKLAENERRIIEEFNANSVLKLNYFVYDMEDVFYIYIIDYRQNISIDKYLNFLNEAYHYFSCRFKKPIKFITVSNNSEDIFIPDIDVFKDYLNKNDIWHDYQNEKLQIDIMYVDTVIKGNISYTTIKKDMVLKKI